jgi:hypothetical protein
MLAPLRYLLQWRILPVSMLAVLVAELMRRYRHSQQQRLALTRSKNKERSVTETVVSSVSAVQLAKVVDAFTEILLADQSSRKLLDATVKGSCWWSTRRAQFSDLLEHLATSSKGALTFVQLEHTEHKLKGKVKAVTEEFRSTLMALSSRDEETRVFVQQFARSHILWNTQETCVISINWLLMRLSREPSPSVAQLKDSFDLVASPPTTLASSRSTTTTPKTVSYQPPVQLKLIDLTHRKHLLTEAFQETLLYCCKQPCPEVVSLLEGTVSGMIWWCNRKAQFAQLIEKIAAVPKEGLSYVQPEHILDSALRTKALSVVREFESTLNALSSHDDETRDMAEQFAHGDVLRWNSRGKQVREFNSALLKVAREVDPVLAISTTPPAQQERTAVRPAPPPTNNRIGGSLLVYHEHAWRRGTSKAKQATSGAQVP